MITKAYEIGKFDGIDVALIICKHGQYSTYKSRVHASWPPSMAKIVSKAMIWFKYTTSVNTFILANCLSSPKKHDTRRYREAPAQKSKEKFGSEE